MNAKIETRTDVRENVGYETAKFSYAVGLAAAVLIGLWGFSCMIGGLVNVGAVGLIKGFFSAVTGL